MKFLILQHVPHEHPGYIADYAKEKDITLDVIELWQPYTLPPVRDYDALIILGGPMGVYEDYPSKQDELTLIRDALGTVPMLGLCLGAQLIAHALGAAVRPNVKDGEAVKEVGYYAIDITPTGQADPLFRGFPSPVTVLEWHGDAFDLPAGAQLLATSPTCTNQAFGYQNAYGLLFHFEFTAEMVKQQIVIDRQWIHKDNDIDDVRLSAEADAYAGIMKQQCYQLLDNFVALVTSQAR